MDKWKKADIHLKTIAHDTIDGILEDTLKIIVKSKEKHTVKLALQILKKIKDYYKIVRANTHYFSSGMKPVFIQNI